MTNHINQSTMTLILRRNGFLNALLLISILIFITGCEKSVTEDEMNISSNPKVAKIQLQEGYVAEHLYSPIDSTEGSWVAMTFDDKGRLITSDQYGSLFRLEIPPIGSPDSIQP